MRDYRDRKHGRPTVGVLAGYQVYESTVPHRFLESVFDGVRSAARNRGCNLLLACGVGSPITGAVSYRSAWPVLSPDSDFVPVGPWNTDGLIVVPPVSAARSRHVQGLIAAGHPVVFVGTGEEGPAVIADNEGGIHQAVAHLVGLGHRRIAFLAVAQKYPGDGIYRLWAYRSAVREYNLEADPRLTVPGLNNTPGGRRAMQQIIESGVSFTAVVANNDESAIGAMQALKEAGLRIPEDVAVVGFDDRPDAMIQVPPLTTVRYPTFEIGYRAMELLLEYIEGRREDTEIVRVLARLVIRESCGCPPEAVTQAMLRSIEREVSRSEVGRGSAQQLASAMAAAMLDKVRFLIADEVEALCQRLVEAFVVRLERGDGEHFRSALQGVLGRIDEVGDDANTWQDVLFVLGAALPSLVEAPLQSETHRRAEDLLQQAQIAVSASARRQHARYVIQRASIEDQLSWMSARLVAAQDETEFPSALAEFLPGLGIRRVWLALYESERDDPVAWSVLHPASSTGEAPVRFSSRQFPPEGIYSVDEPFSLALLPLVVREEALGFVAFDGVNLDPCAAVVRQLALGYERKRAEAERERLLASIERRALQLQTAAEVSRAASSILNPDELIQQAVNLVRERFGLYYVGLFLVDQTGEWTGEPGRWAVLRAGTGEAGRQMLEQGHKLEVGGESMIGWCIANAQARIALDVDEEAVRFELGLPLISRGQAIGALTIQSAQETAFTEEDITVLQTMADQLANAIANARLYEQARRDITERKRAEEEIKRHAAQLATLHEASAAVASHLTLYEIFDAVVQGLSEAFGYRAIGIYLIEEGVLKLKAYGGHGAPFGPGATHIPLEKGVTGRTARSGQPQLVTNVEEDPDFFYGVPGIASEVCVPLKRGNEVLGVLNVESDRADKPLDASDLQLLTLLSNHIVIAIENARLYEAAQRELAERKRAEEALRQLKEFNEGIVQGMEEGIVMEDAEGHITFVNPKMAEILGYAEEKLVGKHWSETVAPSCLRQMEEESSKRLKGISSRYEAVLLRKDSKEVPGLISARPLFGEGEFVGTLATFTDLTERKEMEQQLVQAGKLAAIGQLVAGVAHELNNPLTSVVGYSELLMGAECSQEIKRDLERINRQGVRAARIVENLLTFARRREPRKEWININDVIERSLELQARQLELDHISIVRELDEALPLAMADPFQMQQVFMNIISNAHQALRDWEGERRLRVRSEVEGDMIHLEFADSGPGIPAEVMERLFEPFFTTREVGKGTGLGLSIAYGIVEAHGGRIWAESPSTLRQGSGQASLGTGQVGKGTTFRVRLPISVG